MASISSIASVFVILLVAYCSAVPLPTDNVYTTEKTMVERESMPMTFSGELNTYSTKLDHKREFGHKADSSESREYTTGLPHVQREFVEKKESDESREYTTGLPHVQREFVEKKDSSESREYTTGLPLVERELLEKKDSSESHEYTTGLPHVQREYVEKKESDESHEYTTGLPHVERELVGKKESSESGEYTTERTLINDGHKKRTIFGETTFAPFEATTMISKREHEHVEGDSDEMTTERTIITGERDLEDENTVAPEGEDNNNESDKRSAGIDMFDGLTTEYAMTKDGHHKRTVPVTAEPFYFEATSMFNERALAGESEEKTTERSFIPRTFDFDRFTTMESATDFNGRVEHKNERELVDSELTTFTPESSEHHERAIYQSPSMTLTKDVYRPVKVEKTLTKTSYPSFNQVSYDKSYTKTNYNH